MGDHAVPDEDDAIVDGRSVGAGIDPRADEGERGWNGSMLAMADHGQEENGQG